MANHETPAHPHWQRTVYASWVAQLFSIVAFSSVMPFLPFYIRELGVKGEAQVALWSGVVITAAGLMFAVFAPFWGNLADRYGRKLMVMRAMFGGAVVLSVMGLVTNVYQLVAMRVLQGVLTGTIAASTTLVSSVTPRDRLAYSLGLLQTAVLTGNFVGPWVGGAVADHWGYRVPFLCAGVLLLCGGLCVLFAVHEDFTPLPPGTPRRRGLRQAFGTGGLVAVLGVYFIVSFSGSFVAPIFPLFVEHIAVGYKPATITGLLMGVTGVAAGISALVVGRISRHSPYNRLLAGTTFAAGVTAIPQAWVQSIGQLLGLRVVGGLAAGGTAPLMNAIIGTTVPQEIYGRAYGFTQSASALGWSIGPLVGASVSTVLGLRWPFVIMGALLIACAGLVLLFVPSPDEPSGQEA